MTQYKDLQSLLHQISLSENEIQEESSPLDRSIGWKSSSEEWKISLSDLKNSLENIPEDDRKLFLSSEGRQQLASNKEEIKRLLSFFD